MKFLHEKILFFFWIFFLAQYGLVLAENAVYEVPESLCTQSAKFKCKNPPKQLFFRKASHIDLVEILGRILVGFGIDLFKNGAHIW